MIIYKCPKCGETDNLHYNYDWSKAERPVLDFLCNECGELTNAPQTIDEVIEVKEQMNSGRFDDFMDLMRSIKKIPIISDDFQIGPDGAYEHQDEISDEEIQKAADNGLYDGYSFIEGAKWYREQLKK